MRYKDIWLVPAAFELAFGTLAMIINDSIAAKLCLVGAIVFVLIWLVEEDL